MFLENSVPIKRGTWFIADIPGKWEAFDEHESVVIEDSHVEFVNSLVSFLIDRNGEGRGQSQICFFLLNINVMFNSTLLSSLNAGCPRARICQDEPDIL